VLGVMYITWGHARYCREYKRDKQGSRAHEKCRLSVEPPQKTALARNMGGRLRGREGGSPRGAFGTVGAPVPQLD